MAVKAKPKIGAIAPWYGGNRMNAEKVGELFDGCEWVGIPFAGGMAEIAFIRAREIVANDLHGDIINLAAVLGTGSRDRFEQDRMMRRLRGSLLHPTTLENSQRRLRKPHDYEIGGTRAMLRACDYFTAAWMTRSGLAGTGGEYKGKLCLRWSATGGGSSTRWHSAIDSLLFWAKEFSRCTFSRLDCFDFLAKCKDRDAHGIYCDPPFPGPGDKYKHKFTEEDHRVLASTLSFYRETRVVCRFYDHPLIRELYPASHWRWIEVGGRKQTNESAPEVLIVNGGGEQ